MLDIYGAAAGGLLANGLAFSSLFAAIPTTLLIVGVAGRITDDPAVRTRVAQALAEAFPPLKDLIDESLEAIAAGAALTSILGVLGLIWTVSQLYGALDLAFARIFSTDPERDFFRRTLRGFLVVGILVVVIVGFIVTTALTSAFEAMSPGDDPIPSAITTFIGSTAFLIVGSIVSVLVVYRALPPRAPRWGSVAIPAAVVGLALVVLTQIFMFVVPRLVGVAALAGSLASAFIALAWLSFGFQAVLYGAAWVRVREYGIPTRLPLSGAAPPAEPGGGGE
ncbi:MAG: YihY/virulence factor BrkB family protein [Chloroflexota bacterium]